MHALNLFFFFKVFFLHCSDSISWGKEQPPKYVSVDLIGLI